MARVEAEVGKPKGGFMSWIDARFPLTETLEYHVTKYYASKNFNIWYVFGVLSFVVLIIQLLTGIFLTMNYKPSAAEAFASVEYIMRDVEWGWLIRYMHSTGASFFFIVRKMPVRSWIIRTTNDNTPNTYQMLKFFDA